MKTAVRFGSALLAAAFFLCPILARADSAIPVNMAQLVGRAETIFKGTCTAVAPGQNRGLAVTDYTFQVAEWVKGSGPSPFTFSQWTIKGSPTYEVGQEYWVFLRCSPRGLCSTIGNEQGKFTVIRQEGKSQVVNGRGNVDLFEGAKAQGLSKAMSVGGVSAGASGPIDEEAFRKMVDALK